MFDKNWHCTKKAPSIIIILTSSFVVQVLRTPVFGVFKYPEIRRVTLTAEKKETTRSKTVWLQTKTLMVFLAVCLYASSEISIARLAMKAKKHMKSSTPSKTFWADEGVEMMTSSEVVPWDRSYVYVVSCVQVSVMSVFIIEKENSYCSISWEVTAFYTACAQRSVFSIQLVLSHHARYPWRRWHRGSCNPR